MIALHIEDWIKKYETKTEDAFERKASFELLYIPERGFAEIKVGESALFVWQLCGDGRWWFERLSEICGRHGLRHISAFTCRAPRPFMRIFGYGDIECVDGKFVGRKGDKVCTATPVACGDGKGMYIVTWEV